MSLTENIGGDRLGSGAKMNVDLKTFNRSTHDLSYTWRNTQAPGTLVPFMCLLGLPGDTFDINLNCDVMTHPTTGALFGSFKLQVDLFQVPIRLYNSWLHNNRLGVGLDMGKIKLPQYTLVLPTINPESEQPIDEQQINPSSLWAYLGVRGGAGKDLHRSIDYLQNEFNAIPILAYYDIYKNYYANKQEEIGYILHTDPQSGLFNDPRLGNLITIRRAVGNVYNVSHNIGEEPTIVIPQGGGTLADLTIWRMNKEPLPNWFQFKGDTDNDWLEWSEIFSQFEIVAGQGVNQGDMGIKYTFRSDRQNMLTISIRENIDVTLERSDRIPYMLSFPLENVDNMRDEILSYSGQLTKYLTLHEPAPYGSIAMFNYQTKRGSAYYSSEGLAIKTYQSDLFNNWINTEWIDGENGINKITAVDVSDGYLNLDSLNLAKKVYDMLNRIAISGGSYKDWLRVTYTHNWVTTAEIPVYEGGVSQEIVFAEVISNSAVEGEPLGTIAGRGVLSSNRRGGSSIIKFDEPGFIIGIVSITPRIDYSQGNEFYMTNLKTMNDLHKPGLDGIGFQELLTEQMAAWDTVIDNTSNKKYTFSAGKQPAWINYMTNINKVYGNFARVNNQMYQTLNRRYSLDEEKLKDTSDVFSVIEDLTTYIQPDKYNYAFADTDITAQNFWVQIGCKIISRRKMSAKIIPNL